jgi:ubiquinone/menaquinone biosynthesis C-methylase UbiE
MFTRSAASYDALYFSMKDYAKEAASVAELIRTHHPRGHSVLDVACGTGEHAKLLATVHGFEVDGIDADPGMLELARAKHPRGVFSQADMVAFDLGRRYDAVVCLFSSIAYVQTLPRLSAALGCFRRHLAPGGVVLLEPFLKPEDIRPGHTHTLSVESAGNKITRTSRSEVEGTLFKLLLDYTVEGPGGVERFSEPHELGLFTIAEMLAAFESAGLAATHSEGGPAGRGLYIASVRA